MIRIGQGSDIHALVEGRKLIIGGVDIPHERGLLGHSDADVLVHAVIDALLGAAGVQHELLVLPGVGHGFACAGRRATYSDAATSATWRAILDALAA